MDNFEAFRQKFSIEENTIFRSQFWTWSVRPIQSTIGAGILSLNRPAESMSELTVEEGQDLVLITRLLENTLRDAFSCNKFNYIMLMMVDYHVHYHVIPRYDHTVFFNNKVYYDEWWPKPPIISGEVALDRDLINVRDFLKNTMEKETDNV